MDHDPFVVYETEQQPQTHTSDPFAPVQRLLRNGKPILPRRRSRLDRLLQETLEVKGNVNSANISPHTGLSVSQTLTT
jgi:hypothetical protein